MRDSLRRTFVPKRRVWRRIELLSPNERSAPLEDTSLWCLYTPCGNMRGRVPIETARKEAYHHGDLRQALLDATLKLVDQKGPQGFTLRAAARAAGAIFYIRDCDRLSTARLPKDPPRVHNLAEAPRRRTCSARTRRFRSDGWNSVW